MAPGNAARGSTTAEPVGPARWTQTEISASEFPVPADGYEELGLDLEPTVAPPPPPHPAPAAGPPPGRHPSESSRVAARMAHAPTFKTAQTRGGVPFIPIGVGVALIIAITAVALSRGRPASPPAAAPVVADPRVTTIGRPPEPAAAPPAEPGVAAPVVSSDRPAEVATATPERRTAAERTPLVRQARPAPPPAREMARTDLAATRPAPEPAQVPAPIPAPKVESDPPLPPPPQFVAPPAPASVPPTASAPLAIGPAFARDGSQKARQASPGCVIGSLRLPRDIVDIGGATASVRFAVDDTGQVSQFSYLSGPTDPRISNAIWAAVQRCEWVPGTDVEGRPITFWVTMPFKFGK